MIKMNINNVNQIFNTKLQDINSRIPTETSVNNKFQSLLEQAQLKTSSATATTESTVESTTSNEQDINSLLKTMLSTQSLLNSTSSYSSDASSGLFPVSNMNSTITMLQQSQLLKSLNQNSTSKE